MIGLDSSYGFILVLLVPLLLWRQRLRSGIREIHVSIYPLMKRKWTAPEINPGRKLRLSDRQRLLLLTAAILCLALSINGAHLNLHREKPGNWFLVLDNTPSSAGRTDGRTVITHMKNRILSALDSLNNGNRYTLMVTSPEPRLYSGLDKAQLVEILEPIEPGASSADLETVRRFAGVIGNEADFEKSILVSPRAGLWRDKPQWPGTELYIPPDSLVLAGNAGFTAIEALPAGGGLHNLYLRVAASGITGKEIDLLVQPLEDPGLRIGIDITPDGSGDALIPGIDLAGGAILTLDLNDSLTEDNKLSILAADEPENLAVQLVGVNRPAIETAISTYSGFLMVKQDSSHGDKMVKVYDSSVPEGTLDAPALVIFPVSSFEGIEPKRIWTAPINTAFHPGHPATRNGGMYRDFRPAKIIELNVPEDFQVLADAQGIPVIFSGTLNGHRIVIWGFDPQDNGLFLDPAFPVMLRDTISWLGGSGRISIDFPACLSTRSFSDRETALAAAIEGPGCESAVRESSAISLPDLSGISGRISGLRGNTRMDLDRLFLLLAMVFMMVLGLDRIPARGTDP